MGVRQMGIWDPETNTVVWYNTDELEAAARRHRDSINAPMIITDTMDPIRSHADGLMYDSKSAYERSVKAHGLEIAGTKFRPGFDFEGTDGVTKKLDLNAIESDISEAQQKAVQALKWNEMKLDPAQQEGARAINEVFQSRTGRSATIIKDKSCKKIKPKKPVTKLS